jgi:hypothetical protein
MDNKELVKLVRRRAEIKNDLVGLRNDLVRLEQRIAATSQKYLAAAKVDEIYDGVALIIDDIVEEKGAGNVVMTTFRAPGDDISRSAVIFHRTIGDETFYDLKYRQAADGKNPQGTETSGGRWVTAGEAAIAAKEWIANGRRLGL